MYFLKNKLNNFKLALGFMIALSCLSTLNAQENFIDKASGVIVSSLKSQPKNSFLRTFYRELLFLPVWMKSNGASDAARGFFKHVKNDITLDKNSKLYKDTLSLEAKAKKASRKDAKFLEKIDLEFKISQLYKGYTDYAYMGSINWGAFQARISNLMVNDVSTEWVLHRPSVNVISMAEQSIFGKDMGKMLKDATPKKYHYRALQKEVAKYRAIKANGGWEKVSLSSVPKLGKNDMGLEGLRARLKVTGDLAKDVDEVDPYRYTPTLMKAVKHFQKRNGLAVDGAIGKGTLRVLNKTVDDRITTLLLNLDRIKWLQYKKSKHHIVINIPAFMLYFEENGKLIQQIRTIVGKPKNPTPIFSNSVNTIVLNPYWNLPTSIVQKEMIPKLLKNPNIMKKKGIEIRRGWGKDAPLVDPKKVDWAKYEKSKGIPFHFAQVPGPRNALGKVKFLFPNKYAVYMHDTPNKRLFGRTKRAFSHGCIRLHKPRELLKTFASFNSNIDFEKSQEVLKGKVKTHLALEEKVPVDIIYLTAWVDYDGALQFRDDVYSYDMMQLKSFRKW